MTVEQGGRPVETEAKLWASLAAFRAIEGLDELAGWRVVERRRVDLRDTYWDTDGRALGRAGCTLRVRELDGAPGAELTFKGRVAAVLGSLPGGQAGGSGSRLELTAPAPAGSGPADWARLPAARHLLEEVRALADPAALRPELVLLNPRRELVLRQGSNAAVLSLDEVALEGKPYRRRYVEIEHKGGSVAALERLVANVRHQLGLRPARTGKVQAARQWLDGHRPASGAAGDASLRVPEHTIEAKE